MHQSICTLGNIFILFVLEALVQYDCRVFTLWLGSRLIICKRVPAYVSFANPYQKEY
jgi:hypothetical protein